jgi:predicted GTPase
MPIAAMAAAAAAPLVGGLIKGASGVGKDTTVRTTFGQSGQLRSVQVPIRRDRRRG